MRLGIVVLGLVCVAGCDRVFSYNQPFRPDAGVDGGIDAAPVGSCPAVFGDSRFLYVGTLMAWLAAEASCEALDDEPADSWHTHLAVIEVFEVAQYRIPAGGEAWVGYTDRKRNGGGPPLRVNFDWITDQPTATPVWESDQPDSMSSPPYCATVDGSTLELDDSGCNTAHAFVCECDLFPVNPARIYPAAR